MQAKTRKPRSAPARGADRAAILDEYLPLGHAARQAFLRQRRLSTQQLYQWAMAMYGEGLRKLTRQLLGRG